MRNFLKIPAKFVLKGAPFRTVPNAFTVLELIMVVVVIGILAVLAASRMTDILPLRTQMAARKVQSDIRWTQSLAVNIQKRAGLLFNATTDSYSVYIENTPGSWVLASEPATRKNFTIQLNSGDFAGVDITVVYFNGYDNGLVFDKWGNPYGYNVGTGAATALNNPAGVRITGPTDIRVERGTGRVYII